MKTHGSYSNGQLISAQQDDTLTYYFTNGKVKAQGTCSNNQFQGKWIFYKKEGYLWQVGHFKNNEKHGSWTRYRPDGSTEKVEMFANGKKIKQAH